MYAKGLPTASMLGYVDIMRSCIMLALMGLADSSAIPAVQARITQYCPLKDVCYSLNIPNTTASTGKGDVFFQLSAPTSYSWVAVGQGSRMSNSNIFVIYTSSNGKNVTLSSRLAPGHVQPKYNSAAQATLLDGSGLRDGLMMANVKCANCESWSGGTMDFKGSSASWIWAAKSGDALRSDDPSENISQHGSQGSFKFDFMEARGGEDVSPFTNAVATPSTMDSSNVFDEGSNSQGVTRMLVAHGFLASLAFVILFPAGAISVRILNFPGLIWFHAALQCVSYVVYIAAFGLGAYMATNLRLLNNAHPRLGILLLILLFFQPLLGILHHIYFKRHYRRTFWSYVHLWIGRIAITLGMINGGLGLRLADNTEKGKIAYGLIAAVIWLAYVATAVYGELKRKRNMALNYSERIPDSSQSSIELQPHEYYGESPFYRKTRRS